MSKVQKKTKPRIKGAKAKSKYYSLDNILKRDATYSLIIGERSNGKTYATLRHAIAKWAEDRSEFAILRRWGVDIKGARASMIFAALNSDNALFNMTNGEYAGIHYRAGKFYAANYDEDGKAIYSDSDCMGYALSLAEMEHNKSISYPNVTTIIFDEFLTKHTYLVDEFVLFMNSVSTIVRNRDDVKIFMLGNTVNKYSPYFEEMGLTNISKMAQGEIDVYHYGEDSKLTVAVEYCAGMEVKDKKSNKYFAFDNPKLKMITSGAWELDMYPHLPEKYLPREVLLSFFIEFGDELFQGNIIAKRDTTFCYIHRKTTEIRNESEEIVYTSRPEPGLNYARNITKPVLPIHKKILWYFSNERVYYQSNDVGNTISNFIQNG